MSTSCRHSPNPFGVGCSGRSGKPLTPIFPRAGILLCAFLAAALACFGQGTAGERHALVIGNSSYGELGSLRNSVNDAEDMARVLRSVGFETELLVNADLEAMEEGVLSLGRRLSARSGSVGLFYFAGHGVQYEGMNFLIPAQARIGSERLLKTRSLPVDFVLQTMRDGRAGLSLVMLDACRDNPYSWGRGGPRGLVPVGTQPSGSVVVYATSAGSVAQDGKDRNGVFTGELLKHIGEPGVELKELLSRTGKAVQTATNGKQVPAVYNQYFENFWFAGAPGSGGNLTGIPEGPKPAVTITVNPPRKTYGSLVVSAASPGVLYLDGMKLGELPAESSATLGNIETGSRILELHHAEGTSETRMATVSVGETTEVRFGWKNAVPVTTTTTTTTIPAVDTSRFVRLPGGTFTMGSPSGEANRDSDEGPQHQVRVSAFLIGKYEVTFAEYDAYCDATGTAKPGDQGWGRGTRPVINVRWLDAVAYCNWLSKKEGLSPAYTINGSNVSRNRSASGYRLPTEAEWEYACRAGTTSATAFGTSLDSTQANFDGNYPYNTSTKGPYLGKTTPVGSYRPNAWGLFDMHGNVWEWCQDWYDESYYAKSPSSDPEGPDSGSFRVLRGGSWSNGGRGLRSALRGGSTPGHRFYYYGGFRVVR